jgi:hypothetical protein
MVQTKAITLGGGYSRIKVFLFVFLSSYLSVCLSLCLSVSLSLCLSVFILIRNYLQIFGDSSNNIFESFLKFLTAQSCQLISGYVDVDVG